MKNIIWAREIGNFTQQIQVQFPFWISMVNNIENGGYKSSEMFEIHSVYKTINQHYPATYVLHLYNLHSGRYLFWICRLCQIFNTLFCIYFSVENVTCLCNRSCARDYFIYYILSNWNMFSHLLNGISLPISCYRLETLCCITYITYLYS